MTHMQKLVLAVCSALLCINFSASKAQNVSTVTHSISDDGYASAPLQFNFPYYGQSFNQSWMFSNGVITFRDPAVSGLSWSNLSVQQINSSMGNQFNYSIFPLWTDLINIFGTFQTQSSTTFQRYNWIGISPFYDPFRLNTFSVEIRPDGKILTTYNEINTNYGTIGLTGDVSKGEYEQILNSNYSLSTGTISNWERQPIGIDPCKNDPLYSPTCSGYFDALQKLTSTTSTQTTTPTTIQTVAPSVVSEPVVVQSTTITSSPTPTQTASSSSTTATPSVSNPQPKVGEVQTAGSPPKLSTSQILNMIATEQSRISTVESSVVQDAVKQAESAGASATSQAETIASVTATQSFSGSGLTQNRVMTRQNEVMLSPINIASASYSLISRQSNTSQDTEIKIESTNFGERNLLNPLMQSRELSTETTQSTQQSSVNRNVRNNEAAGNVKVEDLTAQGANISLYASLIIQDAAFYAPKEIYKNQKVIDNPSSRRMFGGSDSLHQRMVDQQYK